jgi:hypothetical protein
LTDCRLSNGIWNFIWFTNRAIAKKTLHRAQDTADDYEKHPLQRLFWRISSSLFCIMEVGESRIDEDDGIPPARPQHERNDAVLEAGPKKESGIVSSSTIFLVVRGPLSRI